VKLRWSRRLDCGCYVFGGTTVYRIPGRGLCCRDCAGIERLMQQPPQPFGRGDTDTEQERMA
jgi:hypothetical protein